MRTSFCQRVPPTEPSWTANQAGAPVEGAPKSATDLSVARSGESIFWREGLHAAPLDLGFRRLVICVGAVETHASYVASIVNVGTHHIPAFAQVQHPGIPLGCPTPWSDSNPSFPGHHRTPLCCPPNVSLLPQT